jgi:hypothetical protein
LEKCEKIIVHYGEFEDDWLDEWKHPDEEFERMLRNASTC